LSVVCFRESTEMETTEGNELEDEDNDGTIHSSVYDVDLERCTNGECLCAIWRQNLWSTIKVTVII